VNRPGPVAVVLLSGGLDSTTCLAIACAEGFTPVALTFRYGQRHTHELAAARTIAHTAGVEHLVHDLDLSGVGGSALLDASIEVPKHPDVEAMDADTGGGPGGSDIPVTYVPARNTVFLAHALAVAEARGSRDIFIGVNAVDYSGYPDCRPEYLAAFEAMANLATRAAVEGHRLVVHAPLIDLTKAQIVQRGVALGVDYGPTSTCYDPAPDGAACGHCDACLLRARGFREAGVPDPTRYAEATA
jgi:7-cyano-7-deazaguanine synthase